MEPQIKLFKFYSPTPCVYSCKCATVNMGEIRVHFFFNYEYPKDQTQVVSLSGKHLYLTSHLNSPPKHSGVRGRGIKSLRSVKHDTVHGSTWHGDIGGLVVKDHLKLFETSFGYLRPCSPPLPHPKKGKEREIEATLDYTVRLYLKMQKKKQERNK